MSALAYKFEEDPEVAVQTAMDSAREAIQEHPTVQGRNEFLEAARLEVIAIHKAVEADSDLKFAQLARMARQANKAKAYNVIVAMMKFIQHHAEVAESSRIRFQQEVDKLRLLDPTSLDDHPVTPPHWQRYHRSAPVNPAASRRLTLDPDVWPSTWASRGWGLR